MEEQQLTQLRLDATWVRSAMREIYRLQSEGKSIAGFSFRNAYATIASARQILDECESELRALENPERKRFKWIKVRGLDAPGMGGIFTGMNGVFALADLATSIGSSVEDVIKSYEGMAAKGYYEVEFFVDEP